MEYVCMNRDCSKLIKAENVRSRVRCLYCGGKMLYKNRRNVNKIKAR
jgi:DNA-directed RNA polymerase subunit RPC12/RpoP